MTASLTVESMLGNRPRASKAPLTPLQWVSVIRQGIPAVAVDSLVRLLEISQAELAAALAIPDRTLARRKKEGKLNSEETAKLVRLARVISRAGEVFEDMDAARHWLKSPNAALAGAAPLSLLDIDIGAESVLDTLGRIEHGVFA